MTEKYTQQEWDRAVGWGKVPLEKKKDAKPTKPFTNHKATLDRYPDPKMKDWLKKKDD